MPPTEISFRGGLNTAMDFLSTPPGQCLTFQDMKLNYGNLHTRDINYLLSNFSGQSIYTARTWEDYVFAIGGIVGGTTGEIYRSTNIWVDAQQTGGAAFSSVGGAISTDISPSTSDVLNSILVFTNQFTSTFCFTTVTATASALSGSPPSGCGSVKVVNNYMFLSNQFGTTSNRVYWSAVGDPTTWPAANFIDFVQGGPDDGVIALGSIGTTLFVFKARSIGALQTNAIFLSGVTTLGPFSLVWNNVGCLGPSCTDNLNDGRLVFVGSDFDCYVTDGYTLTSIANQAVPGLNILSVLKKAATSGVQETVLKFYSQRNEVVICNGFAPFIICFDVLQNYWRQITGFASPNCVGILDIPSSYIDGGTGMPATAAQILLLGHTTHANGASLSILNNENTATNQTLVDENGSTLVAVAATSGTLPENLSESGISSVSVLCQPGSTTATLSIGYDNTYSSTVYSLGVVGKNRFDFTNLAFARTNSQRPASMQLKISSSWTSDIFNKVYVDSELED